MVGKKLKFTAGDKGIPQSCLKKKPEEEIAEEGKG